MNPTIEALTVALPAALVSGAVRAVLGWRVAQDAVRPLTEAEEPVNELDTDREDWDGELAEAGKELADIRKKRAEAQASRVETLRDIYLAGLEIEAEQPEEVPAR